MRSGRFLFIGWAALIFFMAPLGNRLRLYLEATGFFTTYVVLIGFLVSAFLVWSAKGERSPFTGMRAVMVIALTLFFGLGVAGSHYPAEVAHFFQYVPLAWFSARWLSDEKGYGSAFGVALCIGFLDEGLQYFLPSRFFDPFDLLMNGVAVTLGLALHRLFAVQRGVA